MLIINVKTSHKRNFSRHRARATFEAAEKEDNGTCEDSMGKIK